MVSPAVAPVEVGALVGTMLKEADVAALIVGISMLRLLVRGLAV